MLRKTLLASQRASQPVLRVSPTSSLLRNIGGASATLSRGYSAALAQERQPDFERQPFIPLSERQPFDPLPGFTPDTTRGKVSFFNGTIDEGQPVLNFKPGEELSTNIKPSFVTEVDVTDLRHFNPPASLAVEGCEWVTAPTQLTEAMLDEPDKAKVDTVVRSFYLDECAKIVQERTGAVKTVAYQFRHRKMEKGLHPLSTIKFHQKPVPNFHMDNDAQTAEVNLRNHVGDKEAEYWLTKRWGIINVWRPVGQVVQQWPLGLLDSRAIERGKSTAKIHTKHNYKTHFNAVTYQPGYRFYYVSNLAPHEALLFVDYDSKNQKNSGMAHGAFEDMGSPAHAPPRRSIESRVLVLYDD